MLHSHIYHIGSLFYSHVLLELIFQGVLECSIKMANFASELFNSVMDGLDMFFHVILCEGRIFTLGTFDVFHHSVNCVIMVLKPFLVGKYNIT